MAKGPTELVETALHVLVAWTSGKLPDPADMDILKTAFPSSAHLPGDELACQVIHDLCGRILPDAEDRSSRNDKKDDVA